MTTSIKRRKARSLPTNRAVARFEVRGGPMESRDKVSQELEHVHLVYSDEKVMIFKVDDFSRAPEFTRMLVGLGGHLCPTS